MKNISSGSSSIDSNVSSESVSELEWVMFQELNNTVVVKDITHECIVEYESVIQRYVWVIG